MINSATSPSPSAGPDDYGTAGIDASERLEMLAEIKNDLLKQFKNGGCNKSPKQSAGSSKSSSTANSEVPRIRFLDGTLEGSTQMNSIEACVFNFEMQIENGTSKTINSSFFQEGEGNDWLFRLNADGLNPMGASIILVTKPNGGIKPGKIGKILFC